MSDTPLPPKPKKFRPYYRVMPKIASEGYCCIWGYLKLCRERGETKAEMAKFSGITFRSLKNHYSLLKRGEHECQKYSTCLKSVIEELTEENAEKKPPKKD